MDTQGATGPSMGKAVKASEPGGKTIAIAGNIGTGKSSLVEFLTRTYGIQPFYEPNDENPYLPRFPQTKKNVSGKIRIACRG